MAGSASLSEAKAHLGHVDGVMLGRAAYPGPWRLLDADLAFGEGSAALDEKDVFEARHAIHRGPARTGYAAAFDHAAFRGRFTGAGARAFLRHLAENGVKPGAGVNVFARRDRGWSTKLVLCAPDRRD